jgi:hypothetical protein
VPRPAGHALFVLGDPRDDPSPRLVEGGAPPQLGSEAWGPREAELRESALTATGEGDAAAVVAAYLQRAAARRAAWVAFFDPQGDE